MDPDLPVPLAHPYLYGARIEVPTTRAFQGLWTQAAGYGLAPVVGLGLIEVGAMNRWLGLIPLGMFGYAAFCLRLALLARTRSALVLELDRLVIPQVGLSGWTSEEVNFAEVIGVPAPLVFFGSSGKPGGMVALGGTDPRWYDWSALPVEIALVLIHVRIDVMRRELVAPELASALEAYAVEAPADALGIALRRDGQRWRPTHVIGGLGAWGTLLQQEGGPLEDRLLHVPDPARAALVRTTLANPLLWAQAARLVLRPAPGRQPRDG